MRASMTGGKGFALELFYDLPGVDSGVCVRDPSRYYAFDDQYFPGTSVEATEGEGAAGAVLGGEERGQRVAFDIGLVPDGQLVLILEVVAPSGCPAASHNVTLSVRRDMGMQVRRKRRGRRRGRVRISMHSAIAIERACVHANVRVCWSC